jgi:myo-inositol-1(or 4)-monophosphatase
MNSFDSALDLALTAARETGKILRDKLFEPRAIQSKGPRDLVTDADFAAHEYLFDTLRAHFPDCALVSEEAAPYQPDREYAWIFDPLDGTTNYARRYPSFAVSLALARGAQVELGVVYDPLRDDTFWAQRGRGAFVNDARVTVSQTDSMERAVIGMEWARQTELRERSAELLARLIARVHTARTSGSAALSLCYVAAGWLDLYFHLSLKPWDVAAGYLMIAEAGGCITDLRGQPVTIFSTEFYATNGLVHDAGLRILQEPPNSSI